MPSRLLLRPWKDSDLELFAELNADPKVMEFFHSTLTKKQSDELAETIRLRFHEQGWGLWAIELPNEAEFIGFIGLNPVDFEAPFTPAIEVGWRLAYSYWGKGYATEGAKKALEYGFNDLKLNEIVSFTSKLNSRSIKVMEKIGMHRDLKDDFENPKFLPGHLLRPHVLYRITRKQLTENANS